MRRFELHRATDVSGVSGTGIVAEGVEFTDGRAAMRWRTGACSTAVYDSVADIEGIHGHNGATTVEWLDAPVPAETPGAPCPAYFGRRTPHYWRNGRCTACGEPGPVSLMRGVQVGDDNSRVNTFEGRYP